MTGGDRPKCGDNLREPWARKKIQFSQRRANGQALFQLFFYDPNGIKIELNYDAAEADGLAPELMASDFTRR
jgi:hypothetical protein